MRTPRRKRNATRSTWRTSPIPTTKEVQDFAEKAKLPGDDKDPNAEKWAKEGADGKKGSLEGTWDSRWNSNGGDFTSGTAQVKVIGDRVFILYKDQGTYLLEAKRKGKKLIGRYVNVNVRSDTSPFVGQIVDDERIDGIWGTGRWDFRRKLPAKKD